MADRKSTNWKKRRNGGECYYCSREGHIARECPQKEKDRQKRFECYACGGSGHLKRDCPFLVDAAYPSVSRSSSSPAATNVVSEQKSTERKGLSREQGRRLGSTSDNSGGSVRTSGRPDSQKKFECYACGGSGHFKRDCPYLVDAAYPSVVELSRSSSSPAGGATTTGVTGPGSAQRENHSRERGPRLSSASSDSLEVGASGKLDRQRKFECYACGGSGHLKRDCPFLLDAANISRSSSIPAHDTAVSESGSTVRERYSRERGHRLSSASSSSLGVGTSGKLDRQKKFECYACGGSGHLKRDCPFLLDEANISRSSSSPARDTAVSESGSTDRERYSRERGHRLSSASSSSLGVGTSGKLDRQKKFECYACGGSGHLKRDCPFLLDAANISRSSSSPARDTAVSESGSTDREWYSRERGHRLSSASSSSFGVGTSGRSYSSVVTSSSMDNRKLETSRDECANVESSDPSEFQFVDSSVEPINDKDIVECVGACQSTVRDNDAGIEGETEAHSSNGAHELQCYELPDSSKSTTIVDGSQPPEMYPSSQLTLVGDESTSSSSVVRLSSSGSEHEKRSRKLSHFPPFIDTHCHLDYVFERYHHRGTFNDFANRYNYPTNFEGCISTFCDPAAFSSLGSWRDLLSEPNVWGAFGIHPHNAKYFHTNGLVDKLLEGLQHPKCVAFGEIGLDYSDHSPSEPQTQREILRHQLQLVIPFGKPLILHCRDAEQDLFQILTESLPQEWFIHLHCFTGELHVALQFMEQFPNLYLGVCGNVTNLKQVNVRSVMGSASIPLERLLIETDAPYHLPYNLPRADRCRNSHPAHAFYVAKEIAYLRRTDLSEVLKIIRTNTQTLYGV